MQTEYPAALNRFLQNKWFDANVLPYYFFRGILPGTLTQNIDNSERWGIDHIFMFPCRANIFGYLLEFEYDMTEAAKTFNQPMPATPFHAHIQGKMKAEEKQSTQFVANINKQLAELEKEVKGYVVKASTES